MSRKTKTEIESRKEQQATIDKIALEHGGIHTLQSRDSDALDFHDIAVWTLEEMLHEAYEQGRAAVISATAS